MTRNRVIALVLALVAVIVVLLWWRSGSSDAPAAKSDGAGAEVSARDDSATGPRRSVGTTRRNPAAEVEGAVLVEGQVVDAAGKGVEGVDVVFAHKVDEAVTSGADGGFEIALLVGSYEVRASGAEVYAKPQRLEVVAATPPVVVTVSRTSRARGWVIDAAGNPVAGAVVATKIAVARQGAADKDGLLPSVTTDANGVFEVDILPGFNRLVADHPTLGHGRLDLKRVPEGEREEDVRIKLAPYLAVGGVVRAPDGAAVAGAMVTATIKSTALRRTITAVSGADGSFVLGDVIPGEITFDATLEGYGPADPQTSKLAAGDAPPGLTLTLNLPRSVTGRVYDATGEPVYDAKVKVQRIGSNVTFHAARTDVDGAFDLSGLDDGPHQVTVEVGGRPRLSQELTALPETLDLTLPP